MLSENHRRSSVPRGFEPSVPMPLPADVHNRPYYDSTRAACNRFVGEYSGSLPNLSAECRRIWPH